MWATAPQFCGLKILRDGIRGCYLARDVGTADSHHEVLAYMRFLGGGAVDEARLAAFVARSPQILKFFADCGIRCRLVRGVTDSTDLR